MLQKAPASPDRKALLVLMPWASPEFPGLGPSLLYSVLNGSGVPADILYGNLVFSRLAGGDPFVEKQLSKLPVCEVAFSPHYFDLPVETAAARLRDHAAGLAASPERHTLDRYLAVVDLAGRCLDELFEATPWPDYDVVGFSVMMQQTVASLALARRVKLAFPHVTVVFGGPSVAMPMGAELLRCFPEVDYALAGEADATIAPLVRRIREGTVTADPPIPGLLHRVAGEDGAEVRHETGNPAFFRLDRLPVIDYGPYFAQLAAAGLDHVEPSLQIETSRGCWWGAKHHCTFCGIEDAILQYRSKDAEQVLAEMLELSARHRRLDFFCVDSILDHRAYGSLLPKLAELRSVYEYDLNVFVESKSNIKRRHAALLRAAGVSSVQPGLESFSDHVLELMDKGTTGARQIQCLKLLEENGVFVNWNLIYENIGETARDYREILDVIPFVQHLLPLHGEGLIPMQLNRFAPYHEAPERFGIDNIRAKPYYRHVFPDPAIDLDQLAFYFDFDRADPPDAELRSLHLKLGEAVEEWVALYRPESLVQRRGPGFVEIVDRRAVRRADGTVDGSRAEVHLLDGLAAEVFACCDEVQQVEKLVRTFAGRAGAEAIRSIVDDLHERRLVYRSPSDQVINLPLLPEARLADAGAAVPAPSEPVPVSITVGPPGAAGQPAGVLLAAGGAGSPGALADAPRMRLGGPPVETAPSRGGGHDPDNPPWLPLAPGAGAAREMLEMSARHRVLRFELGPLDLADPDTAGFLSDVADLRRDRLFGFALRGATGFDVGRDQAALLARAGVTAVRFDPDAVRRAHAAGATADEINARAVRSLRRLEEHAIDVRWHLATGGNANPDWLRPAAVSHLAPPLAVLPLGGEPDSRAARLVAEWRAGHAPRALTYGRGPGFVRLLDRRGDRSSMRFIELTGAQNELYQACEDGATPAALTGLFPRLTAAQVVRFLDQLVDRGLMLRSPQGRYQSVALRRRLDERWTSAEQ